ncbi:MAG: Uma2 family endonuclease [Rudanella sp.]|nr:Uma2 family endonuclease [Rudanella sp.]
MVMVAQKVYVTPDEYLRLEREADFKSEYIDGEIIPLNQDTRNNIAGGSVNHNRIEDNVYGEFYIHLRGKGCRGFTSDQRVNVPTNSLYSYPDIVVVCGPNQYHDDHRDILTNPMLIVEVLSPSTGAFDRGEKFALYRHSPTFTEYLLIDSEKIRAEVFRKHAEGFWFLASEADQPDGTIELTSIGLTLNMAVAYAETEGVLA